MTVIQSITMDALDLFLSGLRYAPLALLGLASLALLRIQWQEFRKSRI